MTHRVYTGHLIRFDAPTSVSSAISAILAFA